LAGEDVAESELDADGEPESREPFDRKKDLLGRRGSKLRRRLDDLYSTIFRGWEAQAERADAQMDWWDIYHCRLNQNQFYNGNAQVYVPIVRDAVNARSTRFVNQLFPASGRYTDVTTTDGKIPYEIIALLSDYIRRGKIKTSVFKPLCRNGDIEGQYNLYIDWNEIRRQIVSRSTHGPTIEQDGTPVELPADDGEEIEDVTEDDIFEGAPVCEVLHDSDVLVSPATADSVDEALEAGGVVVIVRRWSKSKIERMADAGEILQAEADALGKMMISVQNRANQTDTEKKLAEAVGIHAKGQTATVWEVWHKLPLGEHGFNEDGVMRLCRIWFGPDRTILGAKRNPYWNDRCPLLSEPVEKVAGVFKGQSLVEPIASLQYEANDAANEMADADHYSALPIIARAPGDGGNAPLILNLAAVWDIDPNQVKFMEFPDLGARGLRRIQAATQAIFQSLGVNPAMLPQQTGGGRKRNQAEIAMEQQVDLLTTAEAAQVLADGIGTPMLGWMVDLDHQFRDTDLTVRAYGRMGLMAAMIDVPPLQNRHRYLFTWCGAEEARQNIAMQQQGTAFINVARGLRQELQQEGYRLRIGPMFEKGALNIFGAQTGVQVLEDMRHQMSLDPQLENQMMSDGFDMPVQPMDPDIEHIKAHQADIQTAGDPHGNKRVHLAAQVQQMQAKNAMMMQQAMAQAMQPGAPGVPGGAGPGVAGAPRPPTQGRAAGRGRARSRDRRASCGPDNMPGAGALTFPRRA
jgi:hypothetical protein